MGLNSAVAEYTRERHFSLVRRGGVGTYTVLIDSGSIAIIYILCKRTIKGRIRCRAVAVFIRTRHLEPTLSFPGHPSRASVDIAVADVLQVYNMIYIYICI